MRLGITTNSFQVSGIKGAKGCFTHTAAHLWPYKLVLHLLAKAVENGVNLQTHTPVTSVSEQPDENGYYTVMTVRGSVRARKVIYATNAYSAALLPELQDKIVPVKDAVYAGLLSAVLLTM